jgi:hypothetical protein
MKDKNIAVHNCQKDKDIGHKNIVTKEKGRKGRGYKKEAEDGEKMRRISRRGERENWGKRARGRRKGYGSG